MNEQVTHTIYKHIGLQPFPLGKQAYHVLVCSLSPESHNHIVVNHGQELLIYNSEQRRIIKQKVLSSSLNGVISDPIIKVSYSERYRCIFCLKKSQQLEVYSENGLVLLKKNIILKEIRHSQDWIFLETLNAFLVLTSDCLKIVYVEIFSNHLHSLFKSQFRMNITTSGTFILPPTYYLPFSQNIYRTKNYIFLWNSTDVKMIDLFNDPNIPKSAANFKGKTKDFSDLFKDYQQTPSQLKYRKFARTILHLTNVCTSPEQITKVVFNQQINLLVCGTIYGNLMIFKLSFNNIMLTILPSTVTSKVHVNQKVKKIQNMEKSRLKNHAQLSEDSQSNAPQSIVNTSKNKYISHHETVILAKQYLSFKIQVHNFKSVNHLIFNSSKILFSSGSDDYLQVISLQHMTSIQRFRLSSKISQPDFYFINECQYLAVTNNQGYQKNLYSYQLNLNSQLKWQHKSTIIQAIYNDSQRLCSDDNSIVMVMTDNSFNWVNCESKLKFDKNQLENKNLSTSQKKEDIVKQQISQAFVPKTCKTILCVIKYPYKCSPFQQSEQYMDYAQYWLLTNENEIHKYQTAKSRSDSYSSTKILEQPSQYVKIQKFIDIYQHEMSEKIMMMKFIDLVPINYDSDVKEKKYSPNFSALESVRPIMFGCMTGEVLICPTITDNLSDSQPMRNIIMRIRSFADPIVSINLSNIYGGRNKLINENQSSSETLLIQNLGSSSFFNSKQNIEKIQDFIAISKLIGYCSQQELVMSTISNYEPPIILYKLMLDNSSPFFPLISNQSRTCVLGDQFFGIVTCKIVSVVFCYYSQKLQSKASTTQNIPKLKPKLGLYSNPLQIHQTPILSIEYCSDLCVITGDCSGKIAMWTLQAELLLVIQISELVSITNCYYFSDNHKAVFGYDGQLFETTLSQQEKKTMDLYKRRSHHLQQLDLQKQKQSASTTFEILLKNGKWLDESVLILKKGVQKQNQKSTFRAAQKNIEKNSVKSIVELKQRQSKLGNNPIQNKRLKGSSHSLYDAQSSLQKGLQSKNKNKKDSLNKRNYHTPRGATIVLPSIHDSQKRNVYKSTSKTKLNYRQKSKNKSQIQINHKKGALSVQKFRQEINLSPSTLQFDLPQDQQTLLEHYGYTSSSLREQQKPWEQSSRKHVQKKKKQRDRNKVYENLFHFPNSGLYRQLIHKNMIQ